MGRLDGRIAIVTGGSRGIGAAIATAYAREGARVVIASRKQDALDATAAEIERAHPGRVVPIACHLGKLDRIGPFVERVVEEVGIPDVLVNNAATNPYFGPMAHVEWAAWRKTFEVNLEGPFALTREVVQRLVDAGRPGSIVNVSSVYGMTAAPLQGVYAMTKAAILSLTKTLAFELGPANIRVNAIAPGLVDTRFAAAILDNPQLRAFFEDRAALHRSARPDEIAGMAVYLASEESSFVTGQAFCVDGGYTVA